LSLNLEQKQAVVAEVSAQVAKAQAIVLAEYRSLQVGDMTELRRKARSSGVYLRVLKNTLARRAVADTPFAGLSDKMVGPLAYGISSDPVAVAKVLHVRDQGRRHAERDDVAPAGRRSRENAEPRRTDLDADGNHAGTNRKIRPYPQRGAGQVCAYGCCRARPEARTGCVINISFDLEK
jgi:ribosomal protein L10